MSIIDPIYIEIGAVLVGLAFLSYLIAKVIDRARLKMQILAKMAEFAYSRAIFNRAHRLFEEKKDLRLIFPSDKAVFKRSEDRRLRNIYGLNREANEITSPILRSWWRTLRRLWRKVENKVSKERMELSDFKAWWHRLVPVAVWVGFLWYFYIFDGIVRLLFLLPWLSLVLPWVTQTKLRRQVATLETAIANNEEATKKLREFIKDAISRSKKERQEKEEREIREMEERKQARLLKELVEIRNVIEQEMTYLLTRHLHKSIKLNENSALGQSEIIDIRVVDQIWTERLNHLTRFLDYGLDLERLIVLYQELELSFHRSEEEPSLVEKNARKLSLQETRLRELEKQLDRQSEKVGEKVRKPKSLDLAWNLLKYRAFEQWLHFEWSAFLASVDETRRLLNEVQMLVQDHSVRANKMVSLAKKASWLMGIEEKLRKEHKMGRTVKVFDGWGVTWKVFDEQSPELFANFKIDKLGKVMSNLETDLKSRMNQLGTMVGTRADNLEKKANAPKGQLEELRRISGLLFDGGPKEENTEPVTYTPSSGKSSDGSFTTEFGTEIHEDLMSAWVGTDATRKQGGDVEEESGPKLLDSLHSNALAHAIKKKREGRE